jgi:class 3 adenylate cyclase
LVTLVFTDVVDSVALVRQLGDQAGATFLQRRRQRVRETLRSFPEGEEIETAGDSFLLVFSKPSDAVRFGLLVQAQLRAFSQDSGLAVQERIGIHLGEVVIAEHETKVKAKDLYGIQISTCARVMSLAAGGQVLLTRGVFDSARQVLKGEDIPGVGSLEWLNHGPYLLKGLEEPVEVCEVREGGPEQAPAPPTTSEKAQRAVGAGEEPVLGWRPAVGQAVPNTQWVLEAKLGEGGFGEVWLGRHAAMKERRVFKFCFRADRVRSLKREMTLFRLIKERIGDHPNIVALREVYFDQPPFYVEMDYVAGQDLRTWCEAQGGADQVPLEVRLEIVAQVADALQAAHDAGVIHRDVKPANILVSDKWVLGSGQRSGVTGERQRATAFGVPPSGGQGGERGAGAGGGGVGPAEAGTPNQSPLTTHHSSLGTVGQADGFWDRAGGFGGGVGGGDESGFHADDVGLGQFVADRDAVVYGAGVVGRPSGFNALGHLLARRRSLPVVGRGLQPSSNDGLGGRDR